MTPWWRLSRRSCGRFIPTGRSATARSRTRSGTLIRSWRGRRSGRFPSRIRKLGELFRVNHTAAGELAHHFPLALAGHGETAFGAAELAVERDHVVLGIPGVVDDDRARLRVVVRPVESADLHRKPVFAVVIIAGDVSPVRRGVRPELVREMLDETRMIGVGTAAVRDQMALDAAVDQIDEVETRLARGEREIDHAHGVARPDLVRIERGLGAGEQLRIDAGG